MPSDRELLDAWAQGDRNAGNDLFVRHFDAIFRFFFNRVGTEAEEMTQSTFLGALEARDRFRGASSFRTFLFAIARNQLLLYFRSRRRDAKLTFRTVSMVDLGASVASALADSEERRLLSEAMLHLPVDLQLALELHYWEGLTTREVAEVFESPQGSVKRWLWRARKLLAEQLEARGVRVELDRAMPPGEPP
ncbi:MAG: sigma-70 family RNA polymerase sigma factor [Myxococcota bacterium]